MGNCCASAHVEEVPSCYRAEIQQIKRHIKRVSQLWKAEDFVIHREQAHLIIDVIKKMRDYLNTNRFAGPSFPILIHIYRLLDSLYRALKELRSLQEFWDFSPPMAAGLLPCGQDLSDLGFWADRLNTDFVLGIYPFTKYRHVRPDDPHAKGIRDIIEGREVRRVGCFSSLELVGSSVLPYLYGRDRDSIAEQLGQRSRRRKNTSLVDKKKEFLRHIFDVADDENGLRPLHAVDAKDLAGRKVLLGSGSFGKVYRVVWMGSSCAFKQLESDKKFWMEEARILSKLRHPNIVTLFGCVQSTSSQPRQGILMELLGSSLHDIIFRRKVSTGRPFTNMAALDIMLQIARAMEYLHGRNIIHRDLKPGNILAAAPNLNKRNSIRGNPIERLRVKLTDFGLAKVKENGCETETMTSRQGSGRYRAPEVRLGAATALYNLSADVYSFGITSFEILTGNEGDEDERSRSDTDDFVKKIKTDLLQRCWDSTPRNRPLFPDICELLKKMKHDLAIQEGDNYRYM